MFSSLLFNIKDAWKEGGKEETSWADQRLHSQASGRPRAAPESPLDELAPELTRAEFMDPSRFSLVVNLPSFIGPIGAIQDPGFYKSVMFSIQRPAVTSFTT